MVMVPLAVSRILLQRDFELLSTPSGVLFAKPKIWAALVTFLGQENTVDLMVWHFRTWGFVGFHSLKIQPLAWEQTQANLLENQRFGGSQDSLVQLY